MEIVESIGSPVLWPERDWLGPWLDFVASAVGSLAWPVAIVTLALLFQKPIVELIERMNLFEAGGAKFGFEKAAERLVDRSAGIDEPDPEIAKENESRKSELLTMALTSPSGAVIEAWKDIELAARELAERGSVMLSDEQKVRHFNTSAKRPGPAAFRFISNYGLLPPTEQRTLEELRVFRNSVAHERTRKRNTESAQKYVVVADRIVDLMRQQAREIENGVFG